MDIAKKHFCEAPRPPNRSWTLPRAMFSRMPAALALSLLPRRALTASPAQSAMRVDTDAG